MKYVLRVVNVLAAVIIALALIVLLRTVFTPAGEVPSLGNYSFMRTLTGSMEPAIPVHSFIVTQETDPADLQVGDIITFRATESSMEGALNTHRITSVYEENGQLMFHTKGDANAVEDAQPVAATNVVGRVVFVSAALGTLVSLLSNPLVFFPFILLPLVVLLVLEIFKTVKSAKEVARIEEEKALQEAVELVRRQREQQKQAKAGPEGEADAEGAGARADDKAGDTGAHGGEDGAGASVLSEGNGEPGPAGNDEAGPENIDQPDQTDDGEEAPEQSETKHK